MRDEARLMEDTEAIWHLRSFTSPDLHKITTTSEVRVRPFPRAAVRKIHCGHRRSAIVRSAAYVVKGTPVAESSRIDASVAHPARRYNYWLGGKDHYEADRASGDAIAAAFPIVVELARANRAFL